ncbi:MAG: hypothetical protein ACRC10_01195 [Thermoguttaceae bacterium]
MKKSLLFCAVLLFSCVATMFVRGEDPKSNWYRGSLHMHSFWSDGNVFPEQAIDWYKDHDYNFVILSDHSDLQLNADRWKVIDNPSLEELVQQLLDRYGSDKVQIREVNGQKQVRLKTVWEFKEQLDIPGKFLVIPGHEMNSGINGVTLHGNAINVGSTVRFQAGETLSESIRLNALAVRDAGAQEGRVSFFMLNHPAWPYFDIDAISLANVPEVRFFELINADGGPSAGEEGEETFWSRENYYDAVNAFRAEKKWPLIYGIGTDDTHNYLSFKDRSANPGQCWVMVRSEQLDPTSILSAMYRGDFYATMGVELEEVSFKDKTLSVKVKPKDGLKYTIRFIGTKKNFNQELTPLTVEKKDRRPERKGYTFSKDIGVTFSEVEGTSGSYTLKRNDLYVRAVIVSDEKNESQASYEPDYQTAWTVPVR